MFYIDAAKCNGCLDCVVACNREKYKDGFPDIGLNVPELGQYLMRIDSYTYGPLYSLKKIYVPKLCMQCRNAPCAQVCPVNAFTVQEKGIVDLDASKCIGCRMCVYACPYSTIFYNKDLDVVEKCDWCAANENGKTPACVRACEREALIFDPDNKYAEQMSGYEPIIPEEGMRPEVLFKNIPDELK